MPLGPEERLKAKEIMREITKPVYMCSGTHDRTYSGHSSLSVFEDLFAEEGMIFIDAVAQAPVTRLGERWNIVCVPHMRDMKAQMLRIREEVEDGYSHILLTHGDIKGAVYGSMVVEDGLDLDVICLLYTSDAADE